MNTKNNSRSRETRERLKEALLRLLARRDILDVTVSRLCQEAGVNRSTFYSHYDRIGELMEELEQEIGANLIGRFRGDNYDGEHPFSPGHLLPILEHIRDNRDFYRVYLSQSTAQHRMDWAFGQLLEWYVRPLLRGLSVEEEAIAYYFAFFRAGFLALIQQWLQNFISTGTNRYHCINTMIANISFGSDLLPFVNKTTTQTNAIFDLWKSIIP